uniref:Uncharacterized protein n=1 Tax=Glossina morsitans morsitans TaxID=37546 RepID=A0A1B0GG64_GLOMM
LRKKTNWNVLPNQTD